MYLINTSIFWNFLFNFLLEKANIYLPALVYQPLHPALAGARLVPRRDVTRVLPELWMTTSSTPGSLSAAIEQRMHALLLAHGSGIDSHRGKGNFFMRNILKYLSYFSFF